MSKLIQRIIHQKLKSLSSLESTFKLYLRLQPYLATEQSVRHATLTNLAHSIVPRHKGHFEKLLLENKIPPPISISPVRPVLVSLLTTIRCFQVYGVGLIKHLVERDCQQTDEGLRELNEEGLEARQLRERLIQCRNELEQSGVREFRRIEKADWVYGWLV